MDLQNASSSKCRLAVGTQTVLQARWTGRLIVATSAEIGRIDTWSQDQAKY